ncbi:hypothetical protein NGRA_1824 [Nosema granulosis]|uniref:Uncharacterized protein n=1 Tax=Nosema granulosis TaxID=83296 RepID=A0A9P6GYS9_9MICR|nr:hypothetical protein NGRA_1824 [Nosema granulosis]
MGMILSREEYTTETTGFINHLVGKDSVSGVSELQKLEIQGINEISKGVTGRLCDYNRNLSVISSVIDYNAVRNIFKSEAHGNENTVAKITYQFKTSQNGSKTVDVEEYVSLIEEDNWSLTLCKNSNEVLIYLISKAVVDCTKGFTNSSLRQELGKIENLEKVGKLGYFNSLKQLYESCKEFFISFNPDANTGVQTFMEFFETLAFHRKNKKYNSNQLTREELVKALDCLKDFSKLCESLRRPEEKNKYNMLSNYRYKKEQKIFIDKVLVIKFENSKSSKAKVDSAQLFALENDAHIKSNNISLRDKSIIIGEYMLSKCPKWVVKYKDGPKEKTILIK